MTYWSFLVEFPPLYIFAGNCASKGSAFNCAAGALMLERQMKYDCPNMENPTGATLCSATGRGDLQQICCVRHDCSGTTASVLLTR